MDDVGVGHHPRTTIDGNNQTRKAKALRPLGVLKTKAKTPLNSGHLLRVFPCISFGSVLALVSWSEAPHRSPQSPVDRQGAGVASRMARRVAPMPSAMLGRRHASSESSVLLQQKGTEYGATIGFVACGIFENLQGVECGHFKFFTWRNRPKLHESSSHVARRFSVPTAPPSRTTPSHRPRRTVVKKKKRRSIGTGPRGPLRWL